MIKEGEPKGAESQTGLRNRSQKIANQKDRPDGLVSSTDVPEHVTSPLAVFDLLTSVSLVFGGCCVNVLTFESLLRRSSSLGSLITFGQMLFIACQSLPYFLIWHKSSFLPRLAPRQVPLHAWSLQVLVMLSSSLLNNWSFAFTPLTLQIVFRSSGLPVSMLLGRIFMKKRYSVVQTASVMLVTAGVIIATLSRPSSAAARTVNHADDQKRYIIGICMLSVTLLLTGIQGMLQEKAYKKYGPCWREGVFYTHLLSLPMFVFLTKDIREGLSVLRNSRDGVWDAHVVFAGNLVTQLLCTSGVNQLASRVSSVSTNLVLTARKALSLCLSVWLFGSDWNYQLVIGASLVFIGSLSYARGASRR
ncbi:UAA transporter [Fomitiporia mediterranea MF3/22]|uniref:UAA transporter n=1 Tax=Fomitiporia mediterranea (strain MF3/22) TaxID=694068 RepID=UPI0004408048|nr:UAA transporter [Fomitiporia mediterranea MF3/22]EJD07715.1 UAA transporter [Fomitiporia mediterranea MF3/22]